jgi:hypothetical protein
MIINTFTYCLLKLQIDKDLYRMSLNKIMCQRHQYHWPALWRLLFLFLKSMIQLRYLMDKQIISNIYGDAMFMKHKYPLNKHSEKGSNIYYTLNLSYIYFHNKQMWFRCLYEHFQTMFLFPFGRYQNATSTSDHFQNMIRNSLMP